MSEYINSNHSFFGGPRGALQISLDQHATHIGNTGAGESSTVLSAIDYYAPFAVTIFSTISTLAVFYLIFSNKNSDSDEILISKAGTRTTTLPGYGLLGDGVNDVINVFLDTLAIYVHK